MEFAVDHIREVIWDTELLQMLVIPDDDKTIMVSLAKDYTNALKTKASHDLAVGKGHGLNMLLQCVAASLYALPNCIR